jgi:putative PEP-CTERM system histidine kinase
MQGGDRAAPTPGGFEGRDLVVTRRASGGLGRWLGRGVSRRATYDYERLWPAFTKRLALTHEPDEIARELADLALQASGATSAAVYLAHFAGASFRLGAALGNLQFALRVEQPEVAATFPPGALGVPLRWHGTLVGFLVLGPRSPGTGYGDEDLRFLTAVTEQAAIALAAVRPPDTAPQPRRLETLDRFTAAVIHDLKNAVAALSLLARNTADNFADPEFQRDAAVTLSRTVERMRRLLARLSSPDVTTPPVAIEPIDLRALIIEATTSLAADARVRLVRELGAVKTVYGDRDAILRVVENLTTNAAEALDQEGTVTVTLAEDRGHAVISVADTGCGISEEYRQHHLFSPFHSTKKGGWGIGLYQTKQVVENQDGEIRVESIEGHGTTFIVKLPLRADVESHSLGTVRCASCRNS